MQKNILKAMVSLINDKAEACYRDQMEDHKLNPKENEYPGAFTDKKSAIQVEKGFILMNLVDECELTQDEVDMIFKELEMDGCCEIQGKVPTHKY